MSTSTTDGRPMRADARRNRRRVLDAARVAFEEGGNEVQMEDIARRAGVGIGTIYRHFPTKQALVDELTSEWLAEGAANAAKALELDDPWEGLARFVQLSSEVMARNRGLRDVFGDVGRLFEEDARVQNHELSANVTLLLDRARNAGTLRDDIGFDEFRALMCGLAMAVTGSAPGKHHTYADVVLKGLHT
ncbi:TetR/AcrR family transcriptional regulator [Actinomadura rubrisoli]|uniref:TetR/AcrR family transcriptional regulator n=1 Tax=Actinomadura rubrisoli TaxID=2530368 RepID=A0A4R5CEL9_9ACTN|nr:TetR/AcrR family transcriptional regulator [Actinomadura rubrisoli]TDD95644.1 TetR/AcrR family transcriptional regulator [Actinomadura rubrisoli]